MKYNLGNHHILFMVIILGNSVLVYKHIHYSMISQVLHLVIPQRSHFPSLNMFFRKALVPRISCIKGTP